MMPILLPVLVRRSVRDTTVPATRPPPSAGLHRAGEFRPGQHAQPLERRGIIVERMAGEEEADGVVFLSQPVGRQPRLDRRQHQPLAAAGPPNSSFWPTRRIVVGALRRGQHRIDGGEGARPVRLERIERAGGGKAFQHPLVDGARIDAAGEVGEIGERLVAARGDDASTACRPTPRSAASA